MIDAYDIDLLPWRIRDCRACTVATYPRFPAYHGNMGKFVPLRLSRPAASAIAGSRAVQSIALRL